MKFSLFIAPASVNNNTVANMSTLCLNRVNIMGIDGQFIEQKMDTKQEKNSDTFELIILSKDLETTCDGHNQCQTDYLGIILLSTSVRPFFLLHDFSFTSRACKLLYNFPVEYFGTVHEYTL